MGLFDAIKRGVGRAREIYEEARCRETAAAEADGWRRDEFDNWILPDGRPAAGNVFDGPGSFPSVGHWIDVVCKERGIDAEAVIRAAKLMFMSDDEEERDDGHD